MLERIKYSMRANLDDDTGEGAEGDEDGFTLVELLIVVVVLGILAAVTVFGLSGTTSTSYKSACNADARSVEVATEAFHANNDPLWPHVMTDLTTPDQTLPGNKGVVYLRTAPGNTSKYTITLGAAGTPGEGHVFVNNNDYDAGVNAGTNPCEAIPS